MGCCFHGSTTMPPMEKNSMTIPASVEEFSGPKSLKQEVLIHIPGCKVHLMDAGEALELAQGQFMIIKTLDENVSLATIIKVGDDLQWPLTKDEPVVKLDPLHYLFSLPVKDGEPLSYGVTFSENGFGSLSFLDSFLKEQCCFSGLNLSKKNNLDWKEFAPRVEDYNHFRFGENAGEATEHVFATAGHAANTAWNVFKIRKAITPASSATGGILKSAAKNRSFK